MTTRPSRSAALLNDSARFNRIVAFALSLPLGWMVASVFAATDPHLKATAMLLTGALLFCVAMVAILVISHQADRALRRALEAGSREIATGVVAPVPTIGRLVRIRSAGAGLVLPRPDFSRIGVFVVPLPEGPRRVVAFVPRLQVGIPIRLAVHPADGTTALADLTGPPPALPDTASDVRSLPPTEKQVTGGYGRMALAGLAGAVVGGLLGAVVILL